jgi:hypothetical protein
MRRSIFRFQEMNASEKVFFVVSVAGMTFSFILDLMGILENKLARIFFSTFLGIFLLNWFVVLLKYRKK